MSIKVKDARRYAILCNGREYTRARTLDGARDEIRRFLDEDYGEGDIFNYKIIDTKDENGIEIELLLESLEDLYKRLRDNYNDDKPFEQFEEDRLIVRNAIELLKGEFCNE